MFEPYELIHQVFDAYKGLPGKLAGFTDQSTEIYRSHGRKPKTEDPVANGNVSPVTHYMRYVRKFEVAEPGAGLMLNNRVHAELDMEFMEQAVVEGQRELSQGVLKESSELLDKLIAHDFNECDNATLKAIEEEAAQLRDKAAEVVAHVRAVYREKQALRAVMKK